MAKVNYKRENYNLRDEALEALSKEFDCVSLCQSPNHNKMRFLPVAGEVLMFCGWRLIERNGFSWAGGLFASKSIEESFVFIAKGKIFQELQELQTYTCKIANKRAVVFE